MSKERKENVMMSLVTTGLLCLRTNSQLLQDVQTSNSCDSLDISLEHFTKPTSQLGAGSLTITDVSDLLTWKSCYLVRRDLFVIPDLLPFSSSLDSGAAAVCCLLFSAWMNENKNFVASCQFRI